MEKLNFKEKQPFALSLSHTHNKNFMLTWCFGLWSELHRTPADTSRTYKLQTESRRPSIKPIILLRGSSTKKQSTQINQSDDVENFYLKKTKLN